MDYYLYDTSYVDVAIEENLIFLFDSKVIIKY